MTIHRNNPKEVVFKWWESLKVTEQDSLAKEYFELEDSSGITYGQSIEIFISELKAALANK